MQAFFTDKLGRQRNASPATIAGYRDTFRLLLIFAQKQTGIQPSILSINDLDMPIITAFLTDLEVTRNNSVRTRNTRLAAIRSLFKFAAIRHPEHGATIQRVLSIEQRRVDKPTVAFLTTKEIKALTAAPNRNTWEGRRDHALIHVAIQTGLRVSELTGLNCKDISLDIGANIRCTGKGRKTRCVPLTKISVSTMRVWLKERNGTPEEPLFPTRTGRRLSRDAVAQRLNHHAITAAEISPSIKAKKLSPHVLRHTSAMQLLEAGVDITVIALWLGHEDIRSTQTYLHADLGIKERALSKTAPTPTAAGRYRPPDKLLAFLQDL